MKSELAENTAKVLPSTLSKPCFDPTYADKRADAMAQLLLEGLKEGVQKDQERRHALQRYTRNAEDGSEKTNQVWAWLDQFVNGVRSYTRRFQPRDFVPVPSTLSSSQSVERVAYMPLPYQWIHLFDTPECLVKLTEKYSKHYEVSVKMPRSLDAEEAAPCLRLTIHRENKKGKPKSDIVLRLQAGSTAFSDTLSDFAESETWDMQIRQDEF